MAATVLFDLDCGFCRWSLAQLLAWDRRGRLRAVPIQSQVGGQLLAGLAPERRLASWHLVTASGQRLSAAAALAPLLRRLPGGRPLAALAERLPSAVERGYRFVAEHRPVFSQLVSDRARRRADRRIELRGVSLDGGRAAADLTPPRCGVRSRASA